MYYHIPGTINISVTDDSEFCYDDGADIDVPVRDHKVQLFRCGRTDWYDIEFVRLCAIYEVPIFVDWRDIHFVKIHSTDRMTRYRPILVQPYYLDSSKTLRVCIGYPKIGVRSDGSIYSFHSDRDLPHKIDDNGYHFVSVYSSAIKTYRAVGVHRLVALSWVSKNINKSDYNTVNHIDGNPGNNDAGNLEWMKAIDNVRDGYLRSKHRRVPVGKVRDITTGRIYVFDTYTAIGNFLKMPSVHSKNKLADSAINKLFSGKYEVRLTGDRRPWFYVDNNIYDAAQQNYSHTKYLISVKEPGGSMKIFNGPIRLKQHYGLRMTEHNFRDIIARFKERFPGYEVSWEYLQRNQPIQAINITTGETREFINFSEALTVTGVTVDRLRYAIASGGRTCVDGWRFRQKTDEPWPENYTTTRGRIAVRYKVTDKTNGQIQYFGSMKQVSGCTHLSRIRINRMLSEPADEDQYRIEIEKVSDTTNQENAT